jgi:DNA-directed RNA polymerase subunit RPC12/RpoP
MRNEVLRETIEEARAGGEYRCAMCDYELSRVPLQDDLSIVCPECGYEMVFRVRVQLRPRDPAYDRVARGRLSRIEKTLVILVVAIALSALGLGIIVMAILSP